MPSSFRKTKIPSVTGTVCYSVKKIKPHESLRFHKALTSTIKQKIRINGNLIRIVLICLLVIRVLVNDGR